MAGRKSFSVDVPPEIADQFGSYVTRKGFTKWRTVAAAIDLIQCVPASLREVLMEGDTDSTIRYLRAKSKGNAVVRIDVGFFADRLTQERARAAEKADKAAERQRNARQQA